MDEPGVDRDAMYEAHVAFEVERFTRAHLDTAITEEVQALFAWLAEVSLDDLATPDAVVDALLTSLRTPSGPEVPDRVTESLLAGQAAVRSSRATLGDLVSKQDAQRWATSLAGMTDARAALVGQVTSSRVYTRLVAHVVYQGVKSYMLSENVLTKKIPGASSLVRLGQRGLGAAAPGLEANVDRQLIAFVDANITDTVKDSRRFLDGMLDEQQVAEMSDEAWAAAADSPVAESADLLAPDDVRTLVELVWAQWLELRDTALVEEVLAEAVHGVFAEHGHRPLADLLSDVGVTETSVLDVVLPLAAPAVQHALDTGYIEHRVRERLWAFYSTYDT